MPNLSALPIATAVADTDYVVVATTPTKKAAASLLRAAIGPAEIVPQAVQAWRDTASTDAATVAPKTYSLSRRREGVQTTTAAAAQTIDSGSYVMGGVDMTLPINSIVTVEVSIELKVPAAAQGGSITLIGTFVVGATAGAITRVGADDMPTPKLTAGVAGTTAALVIVGSGIDVQVSPGAVATINYRVFRSQRVGLD